MIKAWLLGFQGGGGEKSQKFLNNCKFLHTHCRFQKAFNICLHVDNIIFNNVTLKYDSMSLIKSQETTYLNKIFHHISLAKMFPIIFV
jgi:hypothetical protein